MSSKVESIQALRDAVIGDENLDEGAKRKKVKKMRGAKAAKRKKAGKKYYRAHKSAIKAKQKKVKKTAKYKRRQAILKKMGMPKKGYRRVVEQDEGDDSQFEQWVNDVDKEAEKEGYDLKDFSIDFPWSDWFDQGLSPSEAVSKAVEFNEKGDGGEGDAEEEETEEYEGNDEEEDVNEEDEDDESDEE